MKKNNVPWVDKAVLIQEIKNFIKKSGGFFRQNAKRMSDFFEMTAYNSIVKDYQQRNYSVKAENLKKRTFRYKLSPSGLSENFSYFIAHHNEDGVNDIEIHHNIKVQSAHDKHIYYTPDISVCLCKGVVTEKQNNKRRHSYIPNSQMITFFETKNHNPFPELLFNFSGLVLEMRPDFITKLNVKCCKTTDEKRTCKYGHLTPGIIISGALSDYTKRIKNSLVERYKYNIFTGTFKHRGKIQTYNEVWQQCLANKCSFDE